MGNKSIQLFFTDTHNRLVYRGQCLHLRYCRSHGGFGAVVREDDDIGLVSFCAAHLVCLALHDGINADVCRCQYACDLCQHACLVGHAQAQVVAGNYGAHGEQGQVCLHGVGLEGQVRHAVLLLGSVQTRHIYQVGNDGTGGGFAACAFALVQGSAYSVAMHNYCIHRAFYVGNQAFGGYEGGVYAQFNALCRAAGYAQQFDAVA